MKIFSFLPLINNSVTTGLSFSLLSIPATMSSKMIIILRFNWIALFTTFYKYHPYYLDITKSFRTIAML